jgi:hypothetical protein
MDIPQLSRMYGRSATDAASRRATTVTPVEDCVQDNPDPEFEHIRLSTAWLP